jgi:hypothetical protein
MKIYLAIIFCLVNTAFNAQAAEYYTFYLGGQSNMDGYGYNKDLPAELSSTQDVMIFHGNGVFDNQKGGGDGVWSKLKPGHGTGFKSNGEKNQYSNRFGAELSFAKQLSRAMGDKKIAIIKYSVGGTGLALKSGYGNWSPDFAEGDGKNQYDFALKTIENAFNQHDIDGDGEPDKLIPAGIIWMQGEADAHTSVHTANAYLDNLKRLMSLMRASLRNDDLPIVIGKITNSKLEKDMMPYDQRVQSAQHLFTMQDTCATFMTKTSSYKYTEADAWHYTSDSYVSMGEDFAASFVELSKECGVE